MQPTRENVRARLIEQINRRERPSFSIDTSYFDEFHRNVALRNHLLAISSVPALENVETGRAIAEGLSDLLDDLPDEDAAIIRHDLKGAGLEGFFDSIGKKLSGIVESVTSSVKSALNFSSYAEHEIRSLQVKLKSLSGSPLQPTLLISKEDYRRLSTPRAKAADPSIVSSYAKTMDRVISSDIVFKETIRYLKGLTDFFKSDMSQEAYADTIQRAYQETISNYSKLLYLKNKVQDKGDHEILGSDLMLGYTQFHLKVFKVEEGKTINGKSTIEFSHPTFVISKEDYKEQDTIKALSIGDIGRLLKEAEFMLKGINRIKAQNAFQKQVETAFDRGIAEMDRELLKDGHSGFQRTLALSAAKGSEKAVMTVAELPLKIVNNHIEIIKTILKVCDKAIDNYSEI